MIGKNIVGVVFIVFFAQLTLFGIEIRTASLPDDTQYFKHKLSHNDVEIIYSKENLKFAQHTAEIQKELHAKYQKYFDWKLDDTLYVGLMSKKNESANGFSTQWPLNREINYMGGASRIDYFCTTSWLDFLLYHETAHNYQINAKKSAVSQGIHSVFGNGVLFLPTYFSVPGSGASSFMLEGNAVLNESWHGIGGRLYNGRLKAMTLLQAKAGNIQAKYLYNKRIAFPYAGELDYHIGGFYNLYMAQKYGLKSINSYFLQKTQEWWWPFFTNDAMKRAVGIDFEDSLNDFAKQYKKMAQKMVVAEGEKIASSQFFRKLSSDSEEIFFLINSKAYSRPTLIVINKTDASIKRKTGSWIPAKVIKKDDVYYTQASNFISPTNIVQGLFDAEASVKKGSESKIIQGYLHDNRAVYFDAKRSFMHAKLYVGEKFYAVANSSVFIDDKDNLYYFKNKGKNRTLYKNKKALYTYQGFYGFVVDVDTKGSIYFISNSSLGSSLYRYKNGAISRVHQADNIVDARLLNDSTLLLNAIGEDEYYYVKSPLRTINERPYSPNLFFAKDLAVKDLKNTRYVKKLDLSTPYKASDDLHYSGTDIQLYSSSVNVLFGNVSINFSDALSQNSVSLFASNDIFHTTLAGISYKNSENIFEYTLSAYGVLANSPYSLYSRKYGTSSSISMPLYSAGYYSVFSKLSYFQDYATARRAPLSWLLSLKQSEKYGISMYDNLQNSLKIYASKERSDSIYGISYTFFHELPHEMYMTAGFKFSYANAKTSQKEATLNARGVKISPFKVQRDMDDATIVMPSINRYVYMKSARYIELGLVKVFNFSSYFFTFPLSLQREALYLKYRHYNVETFLSENKSENVNEYILGMRFDTVFLNIIAPFTLSLDLYYNDNIKFTQDRARVLLNLGGSF